MKLNAETELEDVLRGIDVFCSIPSKTYISGLSDVFEAAEQELTFASNGKYLEKALRSRASVVLTSEREAGRVKDQRGKILIYVDNPDHAIDKIAIAMFGDIVPANSFSGNSSGKYDAHPSASVADDATVEEGCSIGAHAVVDRNVVIGKGTSIGPGSYIAHGCHLGQNCVIGPGVKVLSSCSVGDHVTLDAGSVIGSEPFVYYRVCGELRRRRAFGRVVLEPFVEIGASCTIDRGVLSDTVIGKGAKLDNLIQIAHDVQIGPQTTIAAQCGIAGHVRVGASVTLNGQIGIIQNVRVGDRVTIMAQSLVVKDVSNDSTMMGSPASTREEFAKQRGRLRQMSRCMTE